MGVTPEMIDPREFEPLAYFPWDARPASVPLTYDEAATAIFLAEGDLNRAAKLLKVCPTQLNRLVKQSPRLQRIQSKVRE
jgi:hypothetical protein